MKKISFTFLLPLSVLLLGIIGMFCLATLSAAKKVEKLSARLVNVKTIQVCTNDFPVLVSAHGVVEGAKELVLKPEITGKLVWVSPNALPGSRLQSGAVIAQVDTRDYQLAVNQELAKVESAHLDVVLEQTRGFIARKEWEIGRLDTRAPIINENDRLALRLPQVETALQQKKSAESGLERAQFKVVKGTIRVPFDSIVMERNVEPGEVVGPHTPMFLLVGTDTLWVRVSVPLPKLKYIRIPGWNASDGSTVRVFQSVGSSIVEREGKVIRLLGQLDARDHTAVLLVNLPNPFDEHNTHTPLLVESYVKAEITGEVLKDKIRIPSSALRENNFLWRVSADDRLERVRVKITQSEDSYSIVEGSLRNGDEIVTNAMSFAVPGDHINRVEQADNVLDCHEQSASINPAVHTISAHNQ